MSKERRTFTTEFEHEVAALVIDQGYTYPAACKTIGVGESALRRWVNQRTEERIGITPK